MASAGSLLWTIFLLTIIVYSVDAKPTGHPGISKTKHHHAAHKVKRNSIPRELSKESSVSNLGQSNISGRMWVNIQPLNESHYSAVDSRSSDPPSMPMVFTTSIHTVILFSKFETQTIYEFLGACIIVFMVSAFFEIFRNGQIIQDTTHLFGKPKEFAKDGYVTLDDKDGAIEKPRWGAVMTALRFGFLHVMAQISAYAIMLVIMTYNVWLAISVLCGSGVGHVIVSLILQYHSVETDAVVKP